jgi:hypothetical protein
MFILIIIWNGAGAAADRGALQSTGAGHDVLPGKLTRAHTVVFMCHVGDVIWMFREDPLVKVRPLSTEKALKQYEAP